MNTIYYIRFTIVNLIYNLFYIGYCLYTFIYMCVCLYRLDNMTEPCLIIMHVIDAIINN